MKVQNLLLVAPLFLQSASPAWPQGQAAAPQEPATVPAPDSAGAPLTGELVRFDQGKSLVIRTESGEKAFALVPKVVVPPDVRVGRRVTVESEAGLHGILIVTSINVATLKADDLDYATATAPEPIGAEPAADAPPAPRTVVGRVDAYLPGESITVTDGGGTRATYTLGPESPVPAATVLGRQVTVLLAARDRAETTYEIERDGDTFRIKARTPPPN